MGGPRSFATVRSMIAERQSREIESEPNSACLDA